MSFNVRGLRNIGKQQQLIEFARRQGVDLLFLQETNMRTPQDVVAFRQTNRVDAFFSLAPSRACGTGVVFVSGRFRHHTFCTFDTKGRIICLDLQLGTQKIKIINIYAPVTRNLTNEFFKNLWDYIPGKTSCIIVGDFNCVLDPVRDIRGPGQGRPNHHAKELRKLLLHYNMSDAWIVQHGNEFGGTRSGGKTNSRLDRVYLSPDLVADMVDIRIMNGPNDSNTFSDHKPLSFSLESQCGNTGSPTRWRMDINLLRDPEACQVIKEKLSRNIATSSESTAWDDLKEQWKDILIEAGKERKKRITQNLNEISRRIRIIERGGELTFCTQEYLSDLHTRYQNYIRELKQGTCSTPLSPDHQTATEEDQNRNPHPTLRQNNSIRSMRTTGGAIITNQDAIESLFITHFATIMQETAHCPEPLTSEWLPVLPQISDEDKQLLHAPATKEEIVSVLRRMNKESAPGPDGIVTGFYYTFFPEIGAKLEATLNDLIKNKTKPASFNEGRIVLLLKQNSDPLDTNAWRPITLLNTDYKIATTLLSMRLSQILPTIISDFQAAAVPGRSIFAALTLTRDALAYAKAKQVKGAFITLDQEKAFDNVRHDYMFLVMAQFGFPRQFIEIIKLLYQDSQSDLLINSRVTQPFKVTKGVRQGCALSPSLFVIALDPLLRKLHEESRIRGFPLPGNSEIKLSAFADDISLFVRDEASYNIVVRIFQQYARFSGAKLNEKKSKALCLGNFCVKELGDVKFLDAVKVLGVWFEPGEVSPKSWSEPLSKAQKIVMGPPHPEQSLVDKAEIIRSKICAPALYVARIARMPRRVAKQLETLIGIYLWNKKPAPVPRRILRLPTARGGLAIPHVGQTARILAAKTVDMLINNKHYVGREAIHYWSSTLGRFISPETWHGPRAEHPMGFYKDAINTIKAVEELVPNTPMNEIRPAEVSTEMAIRELELEEIIKSAKEKWKWWQKTVLPSEIKDFEWKRRWGVLPTRTRLQHLGVTATDHCPNCSLPETQRHALKECGAAKAVWKVASNTFKCRLLQPERKKNRFERLLSVIIMYCLWKRRGLAELKRKPQKALYPVIKQIRILMKNILSKELTRLGVDHFLKRWHTRFWTVKNNKIVAPMPKY